MSSVDLIRKVEAKSLKEKPPVFAVGDTVDVSVRIIEGEGKDAKERTQVFSGTVIARKGSGVNSSFTVRRIVANEGVERIFFLHSPKIADVQVRRSGRTRRAKLYYLRGRMGKATKLRDKDVRVEGDADAAPPPAKPEAAAAAPAKA
jgi:large subunit ribosomal protein L19